MNANFTWEIKRELLKLFPEKDCCRLATLCAALDTCGESREGSGSFSFTSESEPCARYLLRLAEESFGVPLTLVEAVKDPKHGKDKLTFSCEGERAKETLESIRAHSPSEELKECCGVAYLRGAFLFGGSCTLPREGTKTGYHLEIDFAGETASTAFLHLLDTFQLIGSPIARGERSVVYFKSREGISDFLNVLGAKNSLERLWNVTEERERSNNRNRVENCTAGNADRAAIASAGQVYAFRILEEKGVLSAVSEPLQEAARARIEEPTLSLSELSERLGVSKSCLNHRFRKLMKLYEEIK